MNALVIKNISKEGPGTIEDFLNENSIALSIVDLSAGEDLPPMNDFTHIVVMGGPMAVYEMDEKYPYLRAEAEYLRTAIEQEKKVLGICLGAQLVAHTLGARVYPGGATETGWYTVELTPEGLADPAVGALAAPEGINNARVFHWHGDTFDLPDGAVRTAASGVYPNQAFRYGNGVHALQFHIEVTPAIVEEWFRDVEGVDARAMVQETEKVYPEYIERARGFYRSFFS